MDSILLETADARAEFNQLRRDALIRVLLENGASGVQATACADLAMTFCTATMDAFSAAVEAVPAGPILTNALSCAIGMITADLEANHQAIRSIMADAGMPMERVAVRLAQ